MSGATHPVGPVDHVFLDASYNNGAAVPSWSGTFAVWAEQSRAIRAANAATMDIAYGSGERQKIDYFPGSDTASPCLVHVHGGYWQRNSRENFAVLGEGVFPRGWSFAVPGYTLAPEASLSEIVGEIFSGLDRLAAMRGPGAGPVIVSGWSAGGHLAALALAHPVVTAGLVISGIFELAPLAGTYINEKMRFTREEIADLSPQRRPPVMKPLVVAYGAKELPALVAQSEGFFTYRRRAGAPGEVIAVADADHFSVLAGMRDPDGELVQAAVRLAEG